MEKEYILSEIRRTAEENGGKPLGKGRFFDATGIREANWSGKHWARWGDALAEAGFEANRFGNPRYTDDFLLSRLAQLGLELDHLPTTAEMRIKARQSQSEKHPSQGTYSRFGTKTQLVTTLRGFCTRHQEFNAVADMCQEWLARVEKPARSDEDTESAAEEGYVYLMKSGTHYKIGKSNSVGRRHRELAIQLPERLALVHAILTDDPSGIERYWHQRFADKRLNGEWFNLTGSDVRAFKRRKFM